MVSLIIVFAGITTAQIWKLRVVAEEVAVAHMVGTLRSALAMQVVERVTSRGVAAVEQLAGINPIPLLRKEPPNYVGELDGPDPARIPGYSWYFDRTSRQLIYRVQNGERLDTRLDGPARIRFRVELSFEDRDGNGRYSRGLDRLSGVDVKPVEPYRWELPNEE